MSHMYSQDHPDAAEQNPDMSRYVKSLHGWSLLVGAVAGLIIGLIIGWVVWPVQWTNAWPADLSQEAKAQYLASVAQIYAYYPDERAVETARTQLYDLNENLPEEIAAAQAYFDENPVRDSRVYITMLGQLAEGLGVASDDIVVVSGEAEPIGVEGAAEPASEGTSWVRWLFSLLLVVLLIGGGVYIISRLAQRRQGVIDGDDEDDSNRYGDTRVDSAPVPNTAKGATSIPASSTPATYTSGADDYRFDQEDEGILYSGGTALVTGEYDDEAYFDDESSAATALPDSEETDPAVAAFAEGTRTPTPAPSKTTRTATGRVLNTYLVHYQAGIVDFEQSHNIIDPATSRYIGECGMGVNVKNGILQDVPENVIALDVWLFDQKRDKSLGNQTRVLLSEYAIDHDLEQAFIREKPDGPQPVVAQPGVSFQLKGQNLILDCEVLEANYATSGRESGVFKNVKVEMTVRSARIVAIPVPPGRTAV